MKKKLKSLLAPAVVTLLAVMVFRFVLLIGYVPTSSMEPTLKEGSYIVGYRFFSELNTGDIIIFRHDGRLLVKRIAAGPGDDVQRGEELLTVPEGAYYVLGDNSENSFDSRYWEDPFVQKKNVLAKLSRH